MTLAYYDNDLVREIADGNTTSDYTLDAADRRASATVTTTGAGTTTTVNHYTDATDNPTWTSVGSTTRRFIDFGSGLAMTADPNGGSLPLGNPHGDIVTTVAVQTPGTTATTIDAWADYDEYGVTDAASGGSAEPYG